MISMQGNWWGFVTRNDRLAHYLIFILILCLLIWKYRSNLLVRFISIGRGGGYVGFCSESKYCFSLRNAAETCGDFTFFYKNVFVRHKVLSEYIFPSHLSPISISVYFGLYEILRLATVDLHFKEHFQNSLLSNLKKLVIVGSSAPHH